MAELADARDLKSRDRKVVWVRSPPPALSKIDQADHLRGGDLVMPQYRYRLIDTAGGEIGIGSVVNGLFADAGR